MSAPRIRVIVNDYADPPNFLWWCAESLDEPPWWCAIDTADTIHEAATAGTKHLREHAVDRLREELLRAGGYSRTCGIDRRDCQAKHCDCADTGRPPEAARPSERRTARSRGSSADDLCHRCGATSGVCRCPHDDPIQTAHRPNGARA